MDGLVDDHPGASQVYRPLTKAVEDCGEIVTELPRQMDVGLGRTP